MQSLTIHGELVLQSQFDFEMKLLLQNLIYDIII